MATVETLEQLSEKLKGLYAQQAENLNKIKVANENLPSTFARMFEKDAHRLTSAREIEIQVMRFRSLKGANALAGKDGVIDTIITHLQDMAETHRQQLELENKIRPLLPDKDVISHFRDIRKAAATPELPATTHPEGIRTDLPTSPPKLNNDAIPSEAPKKLGFVANTMENISTNFGAAAPISHKVWRGLGGAAGTAGALVEGYNAITSYDTHPDSGERTRNWTKTVTHSAVAAGSAVAGVAALAVTKGRA